MPVCVANVCRVFHSLVFVGVDVMIFDFFAFMTVLLMFAHLYRVRVALVRSVWSFEMRNISST